MADYTRRSARAETFADGRPFDLTSYRRGWDTGLRECRLQRPELIDRDGKTPLERADWRGEPNEWYDGYSDQAQGNPKYHYRDCPVCGVEEGPHLGCPIGAC